MFRIGIGHDTHRLERGERLVVGGIEIESELGACGHSDADALAHAITDAILGAMCEGDIGAHFPDTDPQWKNADSLQLLARVVWLAHQAGYRVVNIDANVLLERPKLRPHINNMREKLASVLAVKPECVSVKAKTGEGVDAVGESRAIVAQAVVLLQRTEDVR